MRKMPVKLREQIASDPFMAKCIYSRIGRGDECQDQFGRKPGRPEWEHAHEYAHKQINEVWAVVPCCWWHHQGPGKDKKYNQYISLGRASDDDLAKYPRTDWKQLKIYLSHLYGFSGSHAEIQEGEEQAGSRQ